jgi:maltooligosyltrehalose trehalohydrolase
VQNDTLNNLPRLEPLTLPLFMIESIELSQGAQLTKNGVRYRTWATDKKQVTTVILDDKGKIIRELPMQLEDTGYYSVIDPHSKAGNLYKFRLDGNLYPDMASRFQPSGVHGASQVVDFHGFRWTDEGWKPPRLGDLVIYELHVGTFTKEGTYEAALTKFDDLSNMGVTTIELMPVADFAGNRNWGYDGVFLFSPAHCYGKPDDLRRLVDAAHAAGLSVLLDVVYNHLGPDGNYLGSYSTKYFNPEHHTPWGDAFNLDKPDAAPVRSLFAENSLYWMREFHFDGFRLDATHAIPDESEKHLIQEITESVQANDGIVICEDPRNERKLILGRDKNGYGCDAVWADDFHHVVRVQMTGEDEGYMSYFQGTMEELVKTLNEGWLFTGELQKDGILRGSSAGDIEPEHFVHCISNHDQVGNRAFGDRLNQIVPPAAYRAASALLITAPYTPMFFMGQEWAAETSFLYFTDHHEELGKGITEGRRKEFAEFSDFRDPSVRERIPDPQAISTFENSKLDWDEVAKPQHAHVLLLYTDFLRFRRNRLSERQRGSWTVDQVSGAAIALRYKNSAEGDLLILAQLLQNEEAISAYSLAPSPGKHWNYALSSNELIYGGSGPAKHDKQTVRFFLSGPEVIIFTEESSVPL